MNNLTFLDQQMLEFQDLEQTFETIQPTPRDNSYERVHQKVVLPDSEGKKIVITNPKIPIKLDMVSEKEWKKKFQRMLRGRLPDFGYGCDLVVGENQHFELKLNERIIQERLGQKKAVSRLASSIGKHKNQNKFIKMFKDDNVSVYYEDIQRLKDHYTNINEIINILKENPNLERFRASNGVNPGKKFARKKSEDYSMPLIHQNTIRVNNETMSPVFVSKLPPFNSGDGQRLNKTFLSTKRSNNSKASVNRMVYTQNRKLRKAHIQALSSKQLNELQNKGKKRVKEVRRNEQNSSLGSITNLMNTYFKSFNFDHQNTTKKEKAFLKFGNILKKEFQNDTVKKTVFKW